MNQKCGVTAATRNDTNRTLTSGRGIHYLTFRSSDFNGRPATILIHPKIRKIIALVLVTVIVTVSINAVFSVAHEIEETGLVSAHAIKIGFFSMETSDHCPACPSDSHPNTDHDHVSCDHHNHTSLGDRICYRGPDPIITPLTLIEPFKAMSEVYLDKFIPPQNLA